MEKTIELNRKSPLQKNVILDGGFQSFKVYFVCFVLMISGVAGTAYGSYILPQLEHLSDVVAIVLWRPLVY